MAKKVIKKEVDLIEEIPENIHNETVEEIMGSRYATYAKYVIQDRAIPDARDGLKPVQRRIIYSMYKTGNIFSRPTRKSAHTVGEVMGKYHPHGDSSIYEALVHMSQDWKVNNPLIDFQGNNGSIDDDPPAAYRYTEARLSLIAEEMIRDIEKETVDMSLTFDDDDFEPTVMPSRFPNLLVNGTEGIAVAMATNIPPHNLREVIDAVIFRINHQENVTSEDLMNFIPAPDFPTGGVIYNSQGIKDTYLYGRGRIEIAAKVEVIDNDKTKELIITEIPYGVVKIKLVYQLDKLRHDKVLPGIQEVRDESDIDGIRIVVELKKDANVDAIYKYLMTNTSLVAGFSSNMVAIVNGQPKTMTLLDFIDAYIAHQVDVITRKSTFELKKSKARLEIVDGLIKAISILDKVVEVIRASKDKQDAKKNLQKEFEFTEAQSEAIVMLQLYKLSNTDIKTLLDEKKNLEETIETLNGILSDRKKLDKLLISDLRKISAKYGYDRKSVIMEKEINSRHIDKRDLIVKEETMLAVTRDGYIKRSSIKSYRSSEGQLPGMKDGDVLVYSGKAMTTDYVILFTNLGNFLYIPVHNINENKWKDEGKHVNYLVSLGVNEKIIRGYVIEDFRNDLYFILATKRGQIKRLPLSDFKATRYSKPISCVKLFSDDELLDVAFSSGDSNILLFTDNGYVTLFNEYDIPYQSLRAGGVKSVKFIDKKGSVAAFLTYDIEETRGKVIILTDNAQYRIFDLERVKLSKRPAKPMEIMKCFAKDKHSIVNVIKLNTKEETTKLRVLTSNKEMEEIIIDDYHFTPLDKYCKRNINLRRNAKIVTLFFEGNDYIKKDIISKARPIEIPEEVTEENMSEVSLLDESEIVNETKSTEVVETVVTKEEKVNETPKIEENKVAPREESQIVKESLEKMKEDEEKGYEEISIFDDEDLN